MRLVDTHCHLNFNAFDADRADVIARAAAAGVSRIIIPAVDSATARQALALADQHAGIFAAVGLHPNDVGAFADGTGSATLADLRSLAAHPHVVAVGEIGLDYHWNTFPHEVQAAAFEAQLALAAELRLPVIIHNREAGADVMAHLEAWARTLPSELAERPGVLHSFSADEAIARRALDAGFYLGLTGPLTFRNADELRHIAAYAPLDRLLVETDAPFLTPVPHRGKRNEPAYIPLIVERLASLKQMPVEQVARATTANAERLFRLP